MDSCRRVSNHSCGVLLFSMRVRLMFVSLLGKNFKFFSSVHSKDVFSRNTIFRACVRDRAKKNYWMGFNKAGVVL